MNTPGLNVNGDCAPWYVDVSCPPYNVTPAMSLEDQRKGIQQAWDDVSAAGGGGPSCYPRCTQSTAHMPRQMTAEMEFSTVCVPAITLLRGVLTNSLRDCAWFTMSPTPIALIRR